MCSTFKKNLTRRGHGATRRPRRYQATREQLDAFNREYYLRREKKNVLPDLPPRTVRKVEVQHTEQERKDYELVQNKVGRGVCAAP